MSTATPRARRTLERRRRILDIALAIAEAEGWDAVTTRRLADAIDYSQPVIYQHFANRDELIRALVLEGFEALSARIEKLKDAEGWASLTDACRAYLGFAAERPSLYEAMFGRPTALKFADDDTPPQLRAAFESLSSLVPHPIGAEREAAAERVWACCHGLATLRAAGRIPATRLDDHIHAIAKLV